MTQHWCGTPQVDFDIFERMASRGLHYTYAMMNVDYPSKTLGLWDFAADYVETHFNTAEQVMSFVSCFSSSIVPPYKQQIIIILVPLKRCDTPPPRQACIYSAPPAFFSKAATQWPRTV